MKQNLNINFNGQEITSLKQGIMALLGSGFDPGVTGILCIRSTKFI